MKIFFLHFKSKKKRFKEDKGKDEPLDLFSETIGYLSEDKTGVKFYRKKRRIIPIQ